MSLFDRTTFDAFVTSRPGTEIVDQWDSHVAKVGGKVFALLSTNADAITFKCTPETFAVLSEIDGIGQAAYFAKGQWLTVDKSADLPAADLKAYLDRSYDLIAAKLTKKLRAELGIS
jgi:predicted DNA-binding protein (MmcQ/YjbR family)